MLLRRTLPTVLAVCFAAMLADAAQARVPASGVAPYRFVPGRSVLHQSGGFAGVDERWRIRGTFDLRHFPSPLAVYPPIFGAKFENVDAWATHPVRDDVLILDDVLNLSGLVGGQVLSDRTRSLYNFRGETADGSRVELHAKAIGPWFYMRGGTTAPEGSADYFEYRIRALARLRPFADFNDDDRVDGADLASWAANSAAAGGDFLAWQQQLGEVPPSEDLLDAELDAALASAGVAAGAVPEPTAAALAAAAGLMLLARRRR